MQEICRTNNPVLISWVQAILKSEKIEVLVMDEDTAAIVGGIAPVRRRLMVADEDAALAQKILKAAQDSMPPADFA